MIDVEKASEVAHQHFPYKSGAFYGSAIGMSLGVGVIYDGIRFPLFDEETSLFDTVEGLAYVLTHECDVDQANDRHFNDHVLVCPIIKFDEFAVEFADTRSRDALFGLIPPLAANQIFRALYIPPVGAGDLPFGGVLYLNQITSTHVSMFRAEGAKSVCALSSYAQAIIDLKLMNHLLRPKSESLPRLN